MAIQATDLIHHVIRPTLSYLGMGSPAAEKLLLGTAAQESGLDPFCQHSHCFGIYQISSDQHRFAWDSYLAFRPDLASKVRGLASQHQFLQDPDQELKTNLAYSTAIAWIIYLQSETTLPAADDVDGLSHCWEKNFSHPANPPQTSAQEFARWISCNAA